MKRVIIIGCVILLTQLVYPLADLRVARIFSDNAVLQQEVAVPVWGWSTPGNEVKVTFGGQVKTTVARPDGSWRIHLDAMKASDVAGSLYITSQNDTLAISGVLVGEVWFASGQSNMEWKLKSGVLNQEAEIDSSRYPLIRINTIRPSTAAQANADIAVSNWQVSTPTQVAEFSAVAWFFAKALHLDKKVPVGIIVAARGATNIETWMSRERLMTYPDFYQSMMEFDSDTARWNQKVRKSIASEQERETIARTSTAGLKLKVHTTGYNDAGWKRTTYPLNMNNMGYPGYWGLVWVRKTFRLDASETRKEWTLNLPVENQDDRIYLNGKELAHSVSKLKVKQLKLPKRSLKAGNNLLAVRMYIHWGSGGIGNDTEKAFLLSNDGNRIELDGEWAHTNSIEPPVAQWQNYYNTSTVNYNAMVAPVIPYAIRGFLWYQGENNAGRYHQYSALQSLLIDDWRVRWQQGYLPFLYVQLANYKKRSAVPVDSDDWAAFRDAQTATLQRSYNTAMACAIDIGDANDIHPKNKQEVGRRLFLAAKKVAYGDSLISSGPILKSVSTDNGTIRLHFYYAESGLVVRTRKTETLIPERNKKDAESGSKQLVTGFAIKTDDGNWQWCNAYIDKNEVVLEPAVALSQIQRIQYAWQSNPETNLYNTEGLPAVPFNRIFKTGETY